MSKIIGSIKSFFSKWYNRFRVFCYLFAVWAIFYSTVNICGFSVSFEYDDGMVYSEDARAKAMEKNKDDIYSELNSNIKYERTKIIPFTTLILLKSLGFKIDFIIDRKPINISYITKKWGDYANGFYFVGDQNEKYEILESNKYLIFFTSSDEGIIQARKANTWVIRIKRNPKSKLNPLSYTPGKFNEKVMPLSQF